MPSAPKSRSRDPAVTSRMMARVKSKDSKAELALRRELHQRGLRYRLHARDVPGRPDVVIRSRRLAVFVDGDFWHGNPEEWRRRGLPDMAAMFPSRTDWWVAKITATIERDRRVTETLTREGWTVVRLWESEVLAAPAAAARRVLDAAARRETPEAARHRARRTPATPDPTSYQAPRGRSRAEAVAEQDTAAGGRARRRVGGALASIELKSMGGRRVYAYLRFSAAGRTVNRYVGDAPGGTRAERLRHAWATVHASPERFRSP